MAEMAGTLMAEVITIEKLEQEVKELSERLSKGLGMMEEEREKGNCICELFDFWLTVLDQHQEIFEKLIASRKKEKFFCAAEDVNETPAPEQEQEQGPQKELTSIYTGESIPVQNKLI